MILNLLDTYPPNLKPIFGVSFVALQAAEQNRRDFRDAWAKSEETIADLRREIVGANSREAAEKRRSYAAAQEIIEVCTYIFYSHSVCDFDLAIVLLIFNTIFS